MRCRVLLAFALTFGPGCAHQPSAPTATPAAEKPAHGEKGATAPIQLPHHLVDAAGQPVDDAQLAARLTAARAIFVGEEHPNPHHHAAQLQLLERAFAADPQVGLGLEMLPRTMQPLLDQYLAGALDDEAFQKAVDWPKTWGFPFGLYQPLLAFCRAHHLPAYALNAPHGLTHTVAFEGLEALTPEQKKELPELKPGPAAHRELSREAFGAHPHGKFSESEFERFYTAQLIWDESMAERVAWALAQPGAPKRLVVIAGEGHTRRFAVPERAARRGARPFVILLPLFARDLDDARKDQVADLYWVLEGG